MSFGVSGVNLPGGDLPDGTVLNLGATALTVGTDSHSGTAGREQWDLQTLGISPTWVDGQELTVCANLAPVLESARADGTSLVLTYAEALDAGSTPAPGAYSVTVSGGADPAVSDVSVSGRTVTLTLATAVTGGQAVTLTIHPGEQPGAGRIGPRCPGLRGRDGRRQQRRHGHADDFRRGAGRRDADGGRLGHRGRRRPAVRIRLPVGADRSGGGKTDIGTNMSRYSPTYADVGSTIKVEVSFTDGKGYPEGPLASAPSGAGDGADDGRHLSRGQRLGSGADDGVLIRNAQQMFSSKYSAMTVDTTDFGALDPATIPYVPPDYTVTSKSLVT